MEYRICTNCVMDTSDREITFDENGVCSHCKKFNELARKYPMDDEKGREELNSIIAEIKASGRGKKYDCILGVSGGVDSTYVAYKLKEFGLNPLAVHLDNGWNSELSVINIENTLNILGIDLYTKVLDWEEFKDLQRSFLEASVPDVEIPTDHAFISFLYDVAAKEGIKHIITGSNVSCEGVLPRTWSYGHHDWRYIKSIHKLFGKGKLKQFPHYTQLKLIYYKLFLGQKVVDVLNYMSYEKEPVMELIQDKLNWKYYGGKHYESRYTKFIQAYILPEKFGIDKRRAHLSALICSGQITREEALNELDRDLYPLKDLNEDKEFVIKKLGFTEAEFEEIMRKPPKSYWDYPSYENYRPYLVAKSFYKFLKSLLKK